jgi:hypothetical protein
VLSSYNSHPSQGWQGNLVHSPCRSACQAADFLLGPNIEDVIEILTSDDETGAIILPGPSSGNTRAGTGGFPPQHIAYLG